MTGHSAHFCIDVAIPRHEENMCVLSIDFASFDEYLFGFLNYFDIVIFYVFHFLLIIFV
jgi:hypothetical protein